MFSDNDDASEDYYDDDEYDQEVPIASLGKMVLVQVLVQVFRVNIYTSWCRVSVKISLF